MVPICKHTEQTGPIYISTYKQTNKATCLLTERIRRRSIMGRVWIYPVVISRHRERSLHWANPLSFPPLKSRGRKVATTPARLKAGLTLASRNSVRGGKLTRITSGFSPLLSSMLATLQEFWQLTGQTLSLQLTRQAKLGLMVWLGKPLRARALRLGESGGRDEEPLLGEMAHRLDPVTSSRPR